MGLVNLDSIISKEFLVSAALSLFLLNNYSNYSYGQECLVGKTIDVISKNQKSNITIKHVPPRKEIEYKFDGIKNNQIEQHREVVVKLADRCESTGFEDAALVTGSGRIISIGVPGSAIITLQNGKLFSAGLSYDFKKIMNIIKDEKELYFYHCQPINKNDLALSEPSLIDYKFSTIIYLNYLTIQPNGKVFFRVVENSSSNFPYVVSEFVPTEEIKKLYQVAFNFINNTSSHSSTICDASTDNSCKDLTELNDKISKSGAMMLAANIINKNQFETLCQPLSRKDFENKIHLFSNQDLALYLSKFKDLPKAMRELIYEQHNQSLYFNLRDITSEIFGDIQYHFELKH